MAALSAQTQAALFAALASGVANAKEITDILGGTDAGNRSISGTLTVTGMSTLNGGIVNGSIQNALTALASGGQAGATQLKVGLNRITVVAADLDSVALPAATLGATSTVVIDTGAAFPCAVYPLGASDVINGMGATVPITIQPGGSAEFRCAVAGTWSMLFVSMPAFSWSTNTTLTTYLVDQLTGGEVTWYVSTAATPASIATRTATQMFNDFPGAQIGQPYLLLITNLAAANVLTTTAGAGVTLTGTATVAGVTTRAYVVTFTSPTALVMQNIGAFLTGA